VPVASGAAVQSAGGTAPLAGSQSKTTASDIPGLPSRQPTKAGVTAPG